MKRNLFISMVLVLSFFFFLGAEAFGARTLLDDFSGTYIDGQKWNNRELVREVVDGKLVSKVGNTTTNGQARNNTSIQNPSTIDVIQSDITVVATNLDTGTNPNFFARLDGRFYNTKASGGATGDIWAGIFIGDRGSGLEAWWEVVECQDDAGNNWGLEGSRTLIGPGTLAYGTAYTTKIEYDGANGFTFTVPGQSESFNTGPARQRDAVTGYKGLTTGAYSDGGSGTGYTSALFDNVYINNQVAVYDNFSAAPLDPTKWQSLEVVREISAGKLRLNVQADGSTQTVRFFPNDQATAYLETKVLVESGSQASPGASGRVRLAGYYYNEKGPPYDGYKNDVWVSNQIDLDDSGNRKASCSMWRHDVADPWGAGTSLFYQEFNTAIAFDTQYALSIEHTGSTFRFRCNNETYTYEVTTPMYEPSEEKSCSLQSRVYADAGESGYMKTTFDDVYVAGDNVNPIVSYNNGLAVDFGTAGLYSYDGTSWSQISTNNPEWLTTYNGNLAADFGSTYGLYEYNGSAWSQISTSDADNTGNTMVAYDTGLAVDFGTAGLYSYDGTSWSQISTNNAEWLTAYNGNLAVDFGATYGLYSYDGSAWSQISTGDVDN